MSPVQFYREYNSDLQTLIETAKIPLVRKISPQLKQTFYTEAWQNIYTNKTCNPIKQIHRDNKRIITM